MGVAINAANLDESRVDWQQPYNLDHLWLSRLDMDHAAKAADVLFKFATSEKLLYTATLRLFIPSPCRDHTASIRL